MGKIHLNFIQKMLGKFTRMIARPKPDVHPDLFNLNLCRPRVLCICQALNKALRVENKHEYSCSYRAHDSMNVSINEAAKYKRSQRSELLQIRHLFYLIYVSPAVELIWGSFEKVVSFESKRKKEGDKTWKAKLEQANWEQSTAWAILCIREAR